jgi:hypothetical protein
MNSAVATAMTAKAMETTAYLKTMVMPPTVAWQKESPGIGSTGALKFWSTGTANLSSDGYPCSKSGDISSSSVL